MLSKKTATETSSVKVSVLKGKKRNRTQHLIFPVFRMR